MKQNKIIFYAGLTTLLIVAVFLAFAIIGNVVQAKGLVDETIDLSNEYSKYSLSNYQLDFYVDNSWGWLPWNWSDGLGKSVMYGLYAITSFIWTISLYLCFATGYLIQEAYNLDFISDTANAIGKNIQTLAGITEKGFSTSGFYVGFLLLLVLILGVYVTYIGLIKRETTKAIQAVINFVVIFLLSASFIAYAPSYITKINEFSKDISTASLDVGRKIVLPNSSTQGQDGVDLIRDTLFAIQIKQPWLLLQYDTTDIEQLGEDRVEKLLSTHPDTNKGKDREEVVKEEIEQNENVNLTVTKTISRLGTVFFLLVFNLLISAFVFGLTAFMILSQVLFIVYAMFLPISFLLSLIPSFNGMAKKALVRLFNVIMMRAGITLLLTVAFSISSMIYSIASTVPFFMVMFLQVVTFGGIFSIRDSILDGFALKGSESSGFARKLISQPTRMIRQAKRFQRNVSRLIGKKSNSKSRPNSRLNQKTSEYSNRSNEYSKKQRTGNSEAQVKSRQSAKTGATQTGTNKKADNRNKTPIVKNANSSTKEKSGQVIAKSQNKQSRKNLQSTDNKSKPEKRNARKPSTPAKHRPNIKRNNLANQRVEVDKTKQARTNLDNLKQEPSSRILYKSSNSSLRNTQQKLRVKNQAQSVKLVRRNIKNVAKRKGNKS
jgi:hypothetical protein